ncbi:MAG TPA: quercetin 2,3-dioxygenase [Thermomicrobiales bacterium]|nr:quercetin 2,3-dioxygenase [Thermomicrobiales bacterium]
MSEDRNGFLVGPDDGDHYWFLGTLATVKAGAGQTGGAFTLIEQVAPPGFGPPPHVHLAEDEAFYILDGTLHVTCGDQRWDAPPRSFVFLPRGIPHAFAVADDAPARLLQITIPAQFERFVAEVSEPAPRATLPPPTEPNVPRLLAAMAKFGYEPVGPSSDA